MTQDSTEYLMWDNGMITKLKVGCKPYRNDEGSDEFRKLVSGLIQKKIKVRRRDLFYVQVKKGKR